jgi:hypothetical protein
MIEMGIGIGMGMGGREGKGTYRVCISATTLSSFSTAEIFSADVGWRAPMPKKDISDDGLVGSVS